MAEHRRAPVRALSPAAFAALSVAIACLLVTAEAASVSGSLRAGSGEKTTGNSIPDPPGAELPEPDFNRQPDVAKMHAACDVKALGPVGKGIQMDVDDTDAVVAAGTVEGNAFGKGFDDKVKEAAAKVRSEQAEKCKKGITQFVKHMQKMEDKRIKKEGMRMAALEAKQDAIVKKHEILELQQQGFNRAQAEHVAAVEAQRKEASDREAAQRTVRVAAQREKIAKIREEVKAKQEAKLARVKAKREKEFKKDSEERDKQLAQAEVDKDKKRAKKAAAEQQRKQKIKTNNERIRQRVQRRAQKRKLKMDNMRRRQRERIKRRKLRRLEKKAERRERKNLKKQQKKRKRRRKRRIIRRIIRRTNPDGTVSETVTQVPVVDNSTSTEEPPPPPKKKKRKRKRIIKRIVKRWVTKPADPTAASFRTLPDAPPGPPNPAALKILEDMQNAYNNNNNNNNGKSRQSSEASGDDDEEEETEEESDHLDLLVQMGQHFRELHPSARIHSHRFAPATNGTATDGNSTNGNSTAATANTTAATNATAASNATAATNATGVANATGGSNVTAATGANSTNPSNVTAATNSSTKKPDNDTDDDDKKEVVKPPPPPPPKPPVIPSKISPFDVSKAADALQSIMGPESVPDEKTAKLLAALFANALKLSKIPEPPINKSRPNDIEKMFEKAALGIVDETEKRQEKAIEHATKKRERKEKREEEKKKDEAEEAAFQSIVKRRKALVEKWTELLKLPEFEDPKPMSFYEEARQKMHWLQMTWAFQEQEHKKQLAERDFERAKTKAAEKRLWRQKKQLEELKYMLIVHMNKLGRKPTSIEVPKPAGTPSVKVYQVNTRHASTLLDQEHLTDTSRTMVFPSYALDDRLPVLEADGRDEPVTPIEQLMSIGRMAALDSKETKTAELSEAERLALQFSKGAKVDF